MAEDSPCDADRQVGHSLARSGPVEKKEGIDNETACCCPIDWFLRREATAGAVGCLVHASAVPEGSMSDIPSRIQTFPVAFLVLLNWTSVAGVMRLGRPTSILERHPACVAGARAARERHPDDLDGLTR